MGIKKEKFVGNVFGMDIFVKVPINYPTDLGEEIIQKQLDRASDFIQKLFEKEFRLSTDEELREEVKRDLR